MSYEKVTQAKEVIIGSKQSLKALEAQAVSEVIAAEDAERNIINNVITAAEAEQVPVQWVSSKKKLGRACGIDVGAAVVALKK
ncbi:LSU ribosomal protein L7AE [Salsuginibacillus halophilus]|uniref:LSU ribosomal protein L7AE n=1 Tax=Salsuginibacillus halophilus TaxID=517424 RepID=A0A2P8H520_9BACI|nr:50S ribosomal protein L7ae-like protein [Salsuginibacillus halophilus]PSL41317.1 LSU ribosomal protein L7AE [Salsuginibacillus halophilus]